MRTIIYFFGRGTYCSSFIFSRLFLSAVHFQLIFIVFFFFSFFHEIAAAPGQALAQLVGCSSFVRQDKQQWSPLQGAIALKTGYIKMFYESEVHATKHERSATARFLQELFFLGRDDRLVPTTVKNRFGSDAQVKDIASAAHLVETEDINRVLSAKKLSDILRSKKFKNPKELYNYLDAKEFLDSKKLLKELNPNTNEELYEKLSTCQQWLGAGDIRKKRTAFLGCLQGALCESSGSGSPHAPYTPHTILMGFLASKAASQADQSSQKYRSMIADYFQQMENLGSPITTEQYSAETFLCDSLYTESEKTVDLLVCRLKQQHDQSIPFNQFMRDNYEEIALFGLLQRRYQLIHLLPDYAQVTVSLGEKSCTFADCVEISLLGFLNELWFNPKSKQLCIPDVHQNAQTEKDFFRLAPEVKDFYARFYSSSQTSSELYSDAVHTAWATLFSQRELLPITYCTKDHTNPCEVDATPANAVGLLAHVLGISPPKKELTLSALYSFFSDIAVRINQQYTAWGWDKQMSLQKITAQQLYPSGQIKTQVLSEKQEEASVLPRACEVADVLSSIAQEGAPYYTTIALTFLIKTQEQEQLFSWYFEPRHFWFRTTPIDREKNGVRAQLALSLPDFEQRLFSTVTKDDLLSLNLISLFGDHREMKELSEKLDAASLMRFCFSLSPEELEKMVNSLKNNRSQSHASEVVHYITKIALATEEESFINAIIGLLTSPAWSPRRTENFLFWKSLVAKTLPSSHLLYNKTIMRLIVQSLNQQEAQKGLTGELFQHLCACVSRAKEGSGLQELFFAELKEQHKESLATVLYDSLGP